MWPVSSEVPGVGEEVTGSLRMFQKHKALLISNCLQSLLIKRYTEPLQTDDHSVSVVLTQLLSVCQWSSPLLPPTLPPVLLLPLPLLPYLPYFPATPPLPHLDSAYLLVSNTWVRKQVQVTSSVLRVICIVLLLIVKLLLEIVLLTRIFVVVLVVVHDYLILLE